MGHLLTKSNGIRSVAIPRTTRSAVLQPRADPDSNAERAPSQSGILRGSPASDAEVLRCGLGGDGVANERSHHVDGRAPACEARCVGTRRVDRVPWLVALSLA